MTKTPDEIKKAAACCVIGPSAHQPKCGECPYKLVIACSDELLKDTAELVKQLEAQNADLLENIKWMEAERDDFKRIIRQLEAERDAAVDDMTEMAQYVSDDVCTWCDQCECERGCMGTGANGGFNWRGVQKEE